MNRYYQSYEDKQDEVNCVRNYPCRTCNDFNQWRYPHNCYCLECYGDYSRTSNTVSESNLNHSHCEKCQDVCAHKYVPSSCECTPFQDRLEGFAYSRPEDHFGEEAHYFCGNCNFSVYGNHLTNMPERQYTQSYDEQYYGPSRYSKEGRHVYENNISTNRRNIACLPETRETETENQLRCKRTMCQQNIKSNLGHIKSTSANDSFYSCIPCDSEQIQMVYKNNKNVCSKSSINQSSEQTITSRPSKTIFKKRKTNKKLSKSNIKSGYFEFVSTTQSKHVCKKSSVSQFDTNPKSVSNNDYKKPLHYGYFEVKEKNDKSYSKESSKNISLLELDKVPTKMNKQVDTTHFKESIMLDKALSASINHINVVKTSDKSLTVNMGAKERRITKSDIMKLLKRVSKYQHPQVKMSNKMIQLDLYGSFTKLQSNITNKSAVKLNNSTNSICSNLKPRKSLSEGSLQTKNSKHLNIPKSKEPIITILENRSIYKSSLDVVLDNVDAKVSHKNKENFKIPKEVPKQKPLVTTYNTTAEKALARNVKLRNYSIIRNVRGNNPLPPAQTMEDIDSEEVEVDSVELEERSSLSSYSISSKLHSKKEPVYNVNKSNIAYWSQNSEINNHNPGSSQTKQIKNNVSTEPCECITEDDSSGDSKQNRNLSFRSGLSSAMLEPLSENSSVSSNNLYSATDGSTQDPEVGLYDSRDYSTKFYSDQLDTIQEESEPKMLDEFPKTTLKSTSDNQSQTLKPGKDKGHSMDIIKSTVGTRDRSTSQEQNFELDISKNDYCKYHRCRCCPKGRYYSQFAPNYTSNINNFKQKNEKQHYDQMYDYSLDVPHYKDRNRHSRDEPENTQLLNIISFIVFIVMFYGIFQYISVSGDRFPLL